MFNKVKLGMTTAAVLLSFSAIAEEALTHGFYVEIEGYGLTCPDETDSANAICLANNGGGPNYYVKFCNKEGISQKEGHYCVRRTLDIEDPVFIPFPHEDAYLKEVGVLGAMADAAQRNNDIESIYGSLVKFKSPFDDCSIDTTVNVVGNGFLFPYTSKNKSHSNGYAIMEISFGESETDWYYESENILNCKNSVYFPDLYK